MGHFRRASLSLWIFAHSEAWLVSILQIVNRLSRSVDLLLKACSRFHLGWAERLLRCCSPRQLSWTSNPLPSHCSSNLSGDFLQLRSRMCNTLAMYHPCFCKALTWSRASHLNCMTFRFSWPWPLALFLQVARGCFWVARSCTRWLLVAFFEPGVARRFCFDFVVWFTTPALRVLMWYPTQQRSSDCRCCCHWNSAFTELLTTSVSPASRNNNTRLPRLPGEHLRTWCLPTRLAPVATK